MKTQALFVQLDGTMVTIGDIPEELAGLGIGTRRRASSIVPLDWGRRCAFLLLRLLFGERGKVAEWTRQWSGPWLCRLFETGETYVHQSRRCCLEWEHGRLEEILGDN